MEKASIKTEKYGFALEIIKTRQDKTIELCQKLNKRFINKRFKVELLNNSPVCKCEEYYDRIDVFIDRYRILIKLKMNEDKVQQIFMQVKKHINEYNSEHIKLHWSNPKNFISIRFADHLKNCQSNDDGDIEDYVFWVQNSLQKLIDFIKKFFSYSSN